MAIKLSASAKRVSWTATVLLFIMMILAVGVTAVIDWYWDTHRAYRVETQALIMELEKFEEQYHTKVAQQVDKTIDAHCDLVIDKTDRGEWIQSDTLYKHCKEGDDITFDEYYDIINISPDAWAAIEKYYAARPMMDKLKFWDQYNTSLQQK